jgi:hypothetical protein
MIAEASKIFDRGCKRLERVFGPRRARRRPFYHGHHLIGGQGAGNQVDAKADGQTLADPIIQRVKLVQPLLKAGLWEAFTTLRPGAKPFLKDPAH